jgi:hypothetical protein
MAGGRATFIEAWPPLPLEAWQDTHATLHLWLQIVGKIRLALSPWLNHCWHVTLYVTPSGLTTGPVPHGARSFRIDFDFLRHRLVVRTSDDAAEELPLMPQTVAAFYASLMRTLDRLRVPVHIYAVPNEISDPIPFAVDQVHCAYDGEYAQRYWRVLAQSERVFAEFRARFIGKCSPVHFFWGAPDLAVTRFSGRLAPEHPGGIPHLPDRVTRDAYSHEVSSCGFWAGGGAVPYPAYYAYAYPRPKGFAEAKVEPGAAFFSKDYGEFILPYDVVRTSPSPDAMLMTFLQSTYDAAADLGRWNRAALDRPRDFERPDGRQIK